MLHLRVKKKTLLVTRKYVRVSMSSCCPMLHSVKGILLPAPRPLPPTIHSQSTQSPRHWCTYTHNINHLQTYVYIRVCMLKIGFKSRSFMKHHVNHMFHRTTGNCIQNWNFQHMPNTSTVLSQRGIPHVRKNTTFTFYWVLTHSGKGFQHGSVKTKQMSIRGRTWLNTRIQRL